jgi:hypothetical protein
MLIDRPNPSQIVLQIAANNQDGTAKTELRTARVKVYHVVSGAPVDLLDWTSMTQVGTSNIWHYVWEPGTLPVGQYSVQYALQDMAYANFSGLEDLTIQDFAAQTDVELLKKVARGRWKIDDVLNRMIFYDNDGLAPLLAFDLKDINGLPSSVNVFERVPVP